MIKARSADECVILALDTRCGQATLVCECASSYIVYTVLPAWLSAESN
jgi:hypothetical protein